VVCDRKSGHFTRTFVFYEASFGASTLPATVIFSHDKGAFSLLAFETHLQITLSLVVLFSLSNQTRVEGNQ
jgi:hypothetical protein